MISVIKLYFPQAVLFHLVSKKPLYLSYLRNMDVVYSLLVDSAVSITASFEPAVQKHFQQAHHPAAQLN